MNLARKLAVVAACTLGLSSVGGPAKASYPTYPMAFTSSGVTARTGPSLTYSKTGPSLPNGTRVSVACEQRGRSVRNVYGQSSTIWERLSTGRWVPNVYVKTNVDGWTPGVARCRYDQSAARSWAYANVNAAEVKPGNDCAWFVSHALWAGGSPMSSTWTDDPGVTATIRADALRTKVVALGLATSKEVAWSDNTAGGAQIGDMIAYDWDGAGTVDHVAIVTSLNSSGYPSVTQHSAAQSDRFWSWSKTEQTWLKDAHPSSRVYLIHLR